MAPSDVVSHGGLQPVMTLKTEVAQVRTLHKGDRVSYGWEFEAPGTMQAATLPVGYADGYIRAYRGGYALIHGKKAPIIGRICMDQLMVDVTDTANVKCGDEAVMLGGGGISADELAALSNTINYEVTCLISKRVRRILV
jgi:alanine racemase